MSQFTSIQLDHYQVGTHEGSGVAWETGKTQTSLVATGMTEADALDDTKSAFYGLEGSSDGGKTWFAIDSYTWQGGTDPHPGGGPQYPSLITSFGPSPPGHVRAILGPNQPVSMGVDISFLD